MTTEPKPKPRYKYISYYRGKPGGLFCQPAKIGDEIFVNTRVSILYSAAGSFIVEPLGRGLGLSLLAMRDA